MRFWRSKKQKSGKVSHFRDDKITRDDSEPEELSVYSDVFDEFEPNNPDDQAESILPENEGIDDLSAEQRHKVERFVGSPIVLIHDDDVTKPSLIFDNGEEWVIYKSQNAVESDIRKNLGNKLRNYPEMFDEEWLNTFRMLGMSEENRIIKADEEANRLTKFARRNELFELAKSFGVPVRKELTEEEMRSIVKEGIEKELKHQLQDPVEYYVNLEGRYTISELSKMPWIEKKMDYEGAIKDAIEMDGRANFLSSVDGREVRLDDMYLYRLK